MQIVVPLNKLPDDYSKQRIPIHNGNHSSKFKITRLVYHHCRRKRTGGRGTFQTDVRTLPLWFIASVCEQTQRRQQPKTFEQRVGRTSQKQKLKTKERQQKQKIKQEKSMVKLLRFFVSSQVFVLFVFSSFFKYFFYFVFF